MSYNKNRTNNYSESLRMDISTILGLSGSIGIIVFVMGYSGSYSMYWDFMSLLTVIIGAMFSVLVKWPLPIFISGLKAAGGAIKNKNEDPNIIIEEIITLANIARKESILALEKATINNTFLAKGVKFMVDGYDEQAINDILILDIKNSKKSSQNAVDMYDQLAEACPAFGMIGTVIGLIIIMANLSDPDAIGPGLAVALVTTLYGSLIANVVFIPLGGKIAFRGEEEIQNMLIIKDGLGDILKGTNPRTIQERLESYIS